MHYYITPAVLAVHLILGSSARTEEASFDLGGVKIRYVTEGKGEPVVLIHGLAANAESWSQTGPKKVNVFAALAKDYRVIALDCRGHGKSDKPHDPDKYGAAMTEDVVRLLDHLQIKKAHVVGYSMGAGIACDLLMKHTDRVLSATLGAGGPYFETTRKPATAFMENWAKELDKGEGTGLFVGNDQKAMAAAVRGIIKEINQKSFTEDQLKTNKLPALVVYGSIDIGVPARLKEYELLAKLLGAEHKVIDKGEHVGTESCPEFLEVIQAFLKKHRQ